MRNAALACGARADGSPGMALANLTDDGVRRCAATAFDSFNFVTSGAQRQTPCQPGFFCPGMRIGFSSTVSC